MGESQNDQSPTRGRLGRRGDEERIPRRPSRFTVTALVWLVLAFAAASLMVVSWNSLRVLKRGAISERRAKARAAVEMAYGVVSRYGDLVEKGEMSRAEAQRAAAETARALRYDAGEYVWINDVQPRMVMHPIQPRLEGRELTDFADPDGKLLFVEMVRVARASAAGGFVSYRWARPSGGAPVRKLSFVKLYQPWGWILGSGIYVDGLDATVAGEARRILGSTVLLVLLLCCTGGAAAWNVRRASRLASRARAERVTMLAQLAQADRLVAMGTLAAGVAHEISNPLAYVMAGLEVIGDQAAGTSAQSGPGRSGERQDVLAEMRIACDRIRQVVQDLKLFSRADEESCRLLDVRPVLESSIKMAFNEIRYRARFAKEYGPTPFVMANDARLGQVFLNLLINAAQAIAEGAAASHEIRVVTGTDGGGRAVIEVRDTGSGIAPENVQRIFEPFFTTKPIGVGTGLGLPICRDLVTAMGGAITVESEIGKGSAFRVSLPGVRASTAAQVPTESAGTRSVVGWIRSP